VSFAADDIAPLAAWLAEHGLAELHLTGPGVDLHLVRPMPRALPPAAASPLVVKAPGVGLFLAGHPLHHAALAPEGGRVVAGQQVAFLRIGLLLRPVVSAAVGLLGPALVAEGTMVGYGTPLFLLHPDPVESKHPGPLEAKP
jgi:acetyl-CoA carboxylase biotin carboxyl carrier protein